MPRGNKRIQRQSISELTVKNAETRSCSEGDWVKQPRRFSLLWGLPLLGLVLAALFANPLLKTWLWMISLVWMGTACLLNASRCGRRHCYFTGPFFLAMAAVAFLHGFQIVWLGEDGWWWLTLIIGFGFACLWFFPEYRWGKYADHHRSKCP